MRDRGLITASGLADVEFARELFEELEVLTPDDRARWAQMFRSARLPGATKGGPRAGSYHDAVQTHDISAVISPRVNGHRSMITCERYHAVLPVAELTASIEFYTAKLGFRLDFTQGEPVNFAAVSFGDNAQLFLVTATTGSRGCGLYFVVDDADAMLNVCRSAGTKIVEPIADRPYELRDFSIEDIDGYILTFGHRL